MFLFQFHITPTTHPGQLTSYREVYLAQSLRGAESKGRHILGEGWLFLTISEHGC